MKSLTPQTPRRIGRASTVLLLQRNLMMCDHDVRDVKAVIEATRCIN